MHIFYSYEQLIAILDSIQPYKAMSSSLSQFKKKQNLPIETTFKLPADIPVWPPGSINQ